MEYYLEFLIKSKYRFKIVNKHRLRLVDLKPIQRDYSEIIKNIDSKLKSSYSKQAFNDIKRLTILNPNKREGGIMNCFLEDDNTIICDSEKVFKNCLEMLSGY